MGVNVGFAPAILGCAVTGAPLYWLHCWMCPIYKEIPTVAEYNEVGHIGGDGDGEVWVGNVSMQQATRIFISIHITKVAALNEESMPSPCGCTDAR